MMKMTKKKPAQTTREKLIRLPLPVHRTLLNHIAACIPPGQSRAEWIREAIRQRILRESPQKGA